MQKRQTRYQAAIVQDHQILLLWYEPIDRHGFWVIPGGRREAETEEECVIREAREETNLDVSVERLILEETSDDEDAVYVRMKTYLCSVLGGEASPGVEPEPDAAPLGSITRVNWFDLRDTTTWSDDLVQNPITYPQLAKIRSVLGYLLLR